MDTTIDKAKLLHKLKANRLTHVEDFKETYEGFVKKVIKETQSFLAQVQLDETKVRAFHLSWTKPTSYEEDYDRAIAMVEAHAGDTLTLTEDDFRKYYQDIWGWTREFTSSKFIYTGK